MADRIPMMPPKVFWDVIEASRGPSDLDFINTLHYHLLSLSPDEIIGFHSRLWHYLGQANRRELWEATNHLFGGCNDDNHFHDFGCWLISRGKQFFDAVLDDPDHLTNVFHLPRFDLSELRDSPEEAWCELTECGWGAFDDIRKNAEKTPLPKLIAADWPVDDLDGQRRRWPRLTAAAEQHLNAYLERQP